MIDPGVVQIVIAVAASCAAITSSISVLFVHHVKVLVNSRMSEMLKLAEDKLGLAEASGEKQGRLNAAKEK